MQAMLQMMEIGAYICRVHNFVDGVCDSRSRDPVTGAGSGWRMNELYSAFGRLRPALQAT